MGEGVLALINANGWRWRRAKGGRNGWLLHYFVAFLLRHIVLGFAREWWLSPSEHAERTTAPPNGESRSPFLMSLS